MSFGGFSQSLELVDLFLKRRDAFLQIGFALREGLDLARFNLAFQVHGTELGDFTIEYTNLFARLPIQGPVGGVHHHGGVRNNVGTIVNKAIQIIALAHISEEVPFSRFSFTDRFTLMDVTPKARMISLCLA